MMSSVSDTQRTGTDPKSFYLRMNIKFCKAFAVCRFYVIPHYRFHFNQIIDLSSGYLPIGSVFDIIAWTSLFST